MVELEGDTILLDIDWSPAMFQPAENFGPFVDAWCHRIGPSSCILLRHLIVRRCQGTPARPVEAALDSITDWTGLARPLLRRTIERMVRFHVARWDAGVLVLRYSLPIPPEARGPFDHVQDQ